MTADFHDTKWRQAKTPKYCCVLRRATSAEGRPVLRKSCKIRPGQWYATVAGVFDGDFFSYQMCRIHNAMISAIFDVMDDHLEGINYEHAIEYAWNEMHEAGDSGAVFVKEWRREFRDDSNLIESIPAQRAIARAARKAAKLEALRTGAKP